MERLKALIQATRTFLSEVVGELRKVVWPDRDRVMKLTGVVVAMVVIIAGFLYLWDLGLGALMSSLFGQRG